MPEYKKTGWVEGLDSVRFILACIVMLSHTQNPFIAGFKNSGNALLRFVGIIVNHMYCGVAAVIAFFVISGFVIHYPNKNATNIDIVPFLTKRWVRIGLPLIAIGIFASYNNIFYLLPVWSLYCELFYYTLYPLIVKFKLQLKHILICSYVLAVCVLVLMAADSYSAIRYHTVLHMKGGMWTVTVALIYFPAWLTGVQLASITTGEKAKPTARTVWTWRLLIYAISVGCLTLKGQFNIPYMYSLCLFPIPIYYWLKQEIEYFATKKASRFIEYCGSFSYTLYLCHNLLIYGITKYFKITTVNYIFILLVVVAASFLIALIIEKPSHYLARKLAASLKKTS
jgi:peptidoglycan/LPS O-acetylase OafA/YrhL